MDCSVLDKNDSIFENLLYPPSTEIIITQVYSQFQVRFSKKAIG